MAGLTRARVVEEALDLLDEVGLDQVSTRALAQRLGVKQPSLYWHFKNKEGLYAAMAAAAMAPHAATPLPRDGDDWQTWFVSNTRSFRRALLQRRDGARLHAGTQPSGSGRERSEAKVSFLVRAGFTRHAAAMGMLAASRFTVGSVLEQQADDALARSADVNLLGMDHEDAFNTGLDLIVRGLAATPPTPAPRPGQTGNGSVSRGS